MRIISWNCAKGMLHKMDEIRMLAEKLMPDVFFINEAELTSEKVDKINLLGYASEVSDSISLGKARIIAYVNPMTGFKRKPHLEGKHENIIVLETKDIRVIGLYRGFKNTERLVLIPLVICSICLKRAVKPPRNS